MNYQQATNVAFNALRDGGATVSAASGSPADVRGTVDAFSVALPGGVIVPARHVDVALAILRLGRQHGVIGVWVDGSAAYVEPAVILTDINDAIALGTALDQKSIYDLVAQRVIDL